MKRILPVLSYIIAAICAMTVYSCTELESEIVPEVEDNTVQEDNANEVTLLTIGIHGADADTKLSHVEGTLEGKKVMFTYWSEGDKIIANPSPADESKAYVFNLADGKDTGIGVFACTSYPNGYAPGNYQSNAWTLYFPGDRIQGEQDYLNISYTNQVQNGNSNTDHLKNYHTLRYRLTAIDQSIFFDNSYIDLSGENLDESSCMKFNLSGLPSMVPVRIDLTYVNAKGSIDNLFYTHNHLDEYWFGVTPDNSKTATMTLTLEDFSETTDVTAYLMMSNATMEVVAGGRFRVSVTASDGKKYYCDKTIGKTVTIKGGTLNSITCGTWQEAGNIDGFDNPDEGVVVLQEATKGNGTDIIIMGDGFSATDAHFGASGDYDAIMRQAYADFFSVEPFSSLKDYFNVYYIKAVSEDEHDAVPHPQNGATQGVAKTAFSTEFEINSTNITGNNNAALSYAKQAIKTKGGKGGTACDESTAVTRADKSLIMVMTNVACYAGTCSLSWSRDNVNDYANSYSVAYTALGIEKDANQRRWTTVHEAGGHGFGKLADEYGGYVYTSFNGVPWTELDNNHIYGVFRNVDKHWGAEEKEVCVLTPEPEVTTASNVYWSDLVSMYSSTENLGVYVGGNTFETFYCRPTANSIMRNQFGENGQFFNAASRWAIWYRLMRLTGSTEATQYKSSLEEFLNFDSGLTITQNQPLAKSMSESYPDDCFNPTAPPVLIQGHWENGRFITEE